MRLATRIFEAIAVVLVIFIAGHSNYIDNSRPSHPVGQFIIRTENHGQQVYISPADRAVTTGAWVSFFIILMVCAGLEQALRSDDR
jgi:hypothetical protein